MHGFQISLHKDEVVSYHTSQPVSAGRIKSPGSSNRFAAEELADASNKVRSPVPTLTMTNVSEPSNGAMMPESCEPPALLVTRNIFRMVSENVTLRLSVCPSASACDITFGAPPLPPPLELEKKPDIHASPTSRRMDDTYCCVSANGGTPLYLLTLPGPAL